MCDCPEILTKFWTSALQDWISYSCPRCMWRDSGLMPAQTRLTVSLAPAHTHKGFRVRETYDQPQARASGPVDRLPLPEEDIWPSFR